MNHLVAVLAVKEDKKDKKKGKKKDKKKDKKEDKETDDKGDDTGKKKGDKKHNKKHTQNGAKNGNSSDAPPEYSATRDRASTKTKFVGSSHENDLPDGSHSFLARNFLGEGPRRRKTKKEIDGDDD